MNRPDDGRPQTHTGRAAGLEMLGFGLIALGTMLALAAIAGGTARHIAAFVGLLLVLIGSHIRRKSRTLLWVSSECCPGCGYDLSMTPKRCPACGLHREDWPSFVPRRSRRAIAIGMAVSVAIMLAAGIVFARYSANPAVRWTSLAVLITSFTTSAACFFSLPSPRG